jgi:hypothetical protein
MKYEGGGGESRNISPSARARQKRGAQRFFTPFPRKLGSLVLFPKVEEEEEGE